MANSLARNAVDFSQADDDGRIGYSPGLTTQAGLKSQLEKKASAWRLTHGKGTAKDYLYAATLFPGVLANNLVNAAVSGFTAPHDAFTGELQVQDPTTGHSSDEAVRRSLDLAGLASSATIGASAEEGAVTLGAGAMRRTSAEVDASKGFTKESPFPYAQGKGTQQALSDLRMTDVEKYGHRETIDPSTLFTRQKRLNPDIVQQYVDNPDKTADVAPGRVGNDVMILRHGGKDVLVDGHHRAAAALQAGRSLEDAIVVDKSNKPTAEQVAERNQSLSDKFHEDTLGDMAYEYLEGKGLLPAVNTEGWRAEFRPASKMWKVFDADNNEVNMVNVLGAPTAEDAIKYVAGKSPAERWSTSKLLDFAKKNGWKGPSETGGSVELNAGKSKEAGGLALASDHPQWGQAAFKFRDKLYTDDFHAGAIDKFLEANGYKKAAEGGLEDAIHDMPDLQNVADESLGGIGKDGKFVPFTSDEISKTPRRSGGFFANKSKEAGGLFLTAGKEAKTKIDVGTRGYAEDGDQVWFVQWDGHQKGPAYRSEEQAKAAADRFREEAKGKTFDQDYKESIGKSHDQYNNMTPEEEDAELNRMLDRAEQKLNRLKGEPEDNSGSSGVTLNANKSKAAGGLALASDHAPIFYSAVEKAIDASSTKSASGDQWLGTLRNAPGVKGEEIEWTGLEKALKDRPGANQPKQWTKEEILQAVKANKVNVEEHWKSGNEFDKDYSDLDESGYSEEELAQMSDEDIADLRSQIREINQEDTPDSEATKFSEYQLPGGENYRELVMTLPRNAKDEYYSSHWDETNVLAHVRMNDRYIGSSGQQLENKTAGFRLPGGKKTLFLEELQSDWHQSGRKQGYKFSATPEMLAEAHRKVSRASDALRNYLASMSRDFTGRDIDQAIADVRSERIPSYMLGTPNEHLATDLIDALRERAEIFGEGRVPDAPFKRSWPSLLLNRMVREAAEKGYDQIAWTDGATQAERYPNALRQKVSKIEWEPHGVSRSQIPWPAGTKGHRLIQVSPTGGGQTIVFGVNEKGLIDAGPSEAIGKPVEDIFGKDMGQQILDRPTGSIAGKDFMIGDKGMRGFYDDMLPKIANKNYGKLGGKVRTEKLSTKEAEGGKYDVEQVGDNWLVFKELGTPNDPYVESLAEARTHGQFSSKTEALAKVQELIKGAHVKIHVLPITPQMREHALSKGFPLFSSGVPVPDGSSVEGYQRDKVVPGVKLIPVDHQPEF